MIPPVFTYSQYHLLLAGQNQRKVKQRAGMDTIRSGSSNTTNIHSYCAVLILASKGRMDY